MRVAGKSAKPSIRSVAPAAAYSSMRAPTTSGVPISAVARSGSRASIPRAAQGIEAALVVHGLAGPEALQDLDRLGDQRDARRRVRIRDRVAPPRGRRRRVLGADGEPQIEPAAGEMVDGHRALGEP